MPVFNVSFPVDSNMLNATRIWPLANSIEGYFELPYNVFGVVVFLSLIAIALMLIVGYCYAPTDQLGLALALSLLVLSVPVGNLFLVPGSLGSQGDGVAATIVGIWQVILLVGSLYMAFRIATASMSTKKLNVRTKIHMEMDGKEYPNPYVGCNMCQTVLGLEFFFSCQTCTKGKVAYELCQKCIFEHPRDHEILYWENTRCHGLVDFEATKVANIDEAAEALLGHASTS
mmetsp:Transcript_71843/g.206266  ORF Transcript_71843/g.206266 Transcript_71843/m.206266 type:complete len:230 (-) Transcript_71843:73-762(-)